MEGEFVAARLARTDRDKSALLAGAVAALAWSTQEWPGYERTANEQVNFYVIYVHSSRCSHLKAAWRRSGMAATGIGLVGACGHVRENTREPCESVNASYA